MPKHSRGKPCRLEISWKDGPNRSRQANAIHAWCERRAREIGKWLKEGQEVFEESRDDKHLGLNSSKRLLRYREMWRKRRKRSEHAGNRYDMLYIGENMEKPDLKG